MSSEIEALNYIVTGIGINLAQESFPEELRSMATSVLLELGKNHKEELLMKRHALIVDIVQRIEKLMKAFEKSRDLNFVRERYNALCVNVGEEVRIIGHKNEYFAVGKGIDSNGELLVEKQDGSIEKITSGEVSVRGLYGYV